MVYTKFTKSIFYLLLIVLIIGAGIFGALRLKQVKTPIATVSLNNTVDQLTDVNAQIDQRETATWQQLAHDTGVTKERCSQIQQQLECTYQARENEQPHQGLQSSGLSQKTITLVQGILTDFNIDSSSVIVMAIDENVPAYSDGHRIICINEEALTAYPNDAQKFIIAHELGHIINRHAIQSDALESALQSHPQAHQYTQKFNKMYEMQADATAIAHSKKYAQAGMSYLTTYLERNGNFESPTHPSAHERLAVAQKIHTALNHA